MISGGAPLSSPATHAFGNFSFVPASPGWVPLCRARGGLCKAFKWLIRFDTVVG